MDLQTFLKFGVGSRFGQVEDTYPAPSHGRDAFIVRFAKESSVSQALGVGMIAEKSIRILIRPVHRSKWMNTHQHQQTRRLPPLPIAHQQPTWTCSTPSGMKADYTHTAARSPSSSATPTHTPERSQLGISSSHKGIEVLPHTVVSGHSVAQETALPVVEPTGIPDTDQSREIMESTHSHDRATSVKDDKDHKPEQASTRALSVQTKKTKKKEITSQPKPPPEETAGGKDSGCSKTPPVSEDSRRSLPKTAHVALPSSPLMPASVTAEASKANLSAALCSDIRNGSQTPKSQEKEVKEAPTPERVDSPRPNSSTIDKTVQDDASTEKRKRPVSSHVNKAQYSAPKGVADLPPATKTSENIFTEDEIKERKQAWNRIPMPLDPRKSKKLGTSVISGQLHMPQAQKEPLHNVMESTRVSVPCMEEQDQLESSEISGAGKTKPEQSMKRVEESAEAAENVIQQLLKDEGFSLEQISCVPNELSRAKLKNEEGSYSSKLQSSEPLQWTSEQSIEDTVMTPGTVLSINGNKANAAANNQGKQKGKWNKNKKAKKRLASVLQTELQKETDSQEVSPSDLEISAMPVKEKSQVDDETLMPPSATAGSPLHSICFPEKTNELPIEPFKDSKEQTMTGNRTQYPYDTLPRGRLDFRNNAGGSLKIPKKRKNKYPPITSKTFEPSTTGKFIPSQSRYAAGGPMPTPDTEGAGATSSVTQAGESDPSKRSRLNPLATSFVSPRKATATAVGTETVPYSPRAASSRAGSGEVSLENIQSPSKFKIMQRPVTAHNSPSKAPQLREKLSQGFKRSDNFESLMQQQENSRNEIQRDWSKDRHQRERENIKLVNSNTTSPRKDGGKKNDDLDTQDWPALPVSRVRSATLQ